MRPGAAYHVYDLADFLADDIDGVHAALRELVDDVAAGAAPPLPVRAFPAHEVGAAFRYMAQARHVGKVVVVHRADAPRDAHRRELSRHRWPRRDRPRRRRAGSSSRGRGPSLLAGRRAPDAAAQETIAALRESGADVRVVQADVADPAGVAAMLDAATGRR